MPTVAEAPPRTTRPPIRVRPAPRHDPPYDDELDSLRAADSNPQQLAFEFPRRRARPTRPEAPPKPAAPSSGEAKLAVRRFVHRCVEVLNGYRPATHLRHLSLPRESLTVVAQAAAGATRVAEIRRAHTDALQGPVRGLHAATSPSAPDLGLRSTTPLGAPDPHTAASPPGRHSRTAASPPAQRAGRLPSTAGSPSAPRVSRHAGTAAPSPAPRAGRRSTDRRDRGAPPTAVVRLQLCEPRPGAVEAAVLLVTGDRTWAMALRLEQHDDSWYATALRLI